MDLRKTPLNEIHRKLGGRMVPFAGWEMPVQYSSIIEEHMAVRNGAGIFDVSHMGEILVKGKGSVSFLESITCNRINEIANGQVQYNAVLNEAGGIVDDVTVYRVNAEEYFIVSNASNYEAVEKHLRKYAPQDVEIENQSAAWHQIAFQGPHADDMMSDYLGKSLHSIHYYRFEDLSFQNKTIRLSRTGYTGEDGFEIYSDVETGLRIWKELLEKYSSKGLLPCGLGARDSLRLEARYPLYGHELNETLTPVESGIGWIVKEKDKPFFGYEKIISQKLRGSEFKVAGFILEEAGVPREGYDVISAGGKLGKVLSGGHSPLLKKGIGTALLPAGCPEEISIDIRSRPHAARLHKGPFYKGSAGKK